MSVPHVDVRALFDLTNRTALVTGGSRGLGLETAMALSEAGAAVAIMGRRMSWLTSAAEELRRRGHSCRIIESDVADTDQATRAVRDTVEALGGLDILVNNAGISWGAPAEELPLEKWNEVLATNVTGTFLMAQAAMHVMRKTGGTIINIASVAGIVGTAPEVLDATGYAASKGAVIALTHDLAVKWARHGIRVNAIAPGFFEGHRAGTCADRAAHADGPDRPPGRIGRRGGVSGVGCLALRDRTGAAGRRRHAGLVGHPDHS